MLLDPGGPEITLRIAFALAGSTQLARLDTWPVSPATTIGLPLYLTTERLQLVKIALIRAHMKKF